MSGEERSITTNEQGIVQAVSAAFAVSYGWTAELLVGLPLVEVIPAAYHQAHQSGFSRFLATQVPHLLGEPLRLPVRTSAGQTRVSEVYLYAQRENDGWTFSASVNPIG